MGRSRAWTSSADGHLTVRVEMFGRATPVSVRADQVQTSDADPRDGWRAQMAADSALGLRWALDAWWIARLDEPDDDRVGEWTVFDAFQERTREATAARLAALLADFDETFTDTAFQARTRTAGTSRAWPELPRGRVPFPWTMSTTSRCAGWYGVPMGWSCPTTCSGVS
jgi:hypothetical protein